MSGGVDSSVAAYLLKEQGYDVIGVTMKVWPQDCISRAEDKCCGPQAVADARGVAHALGIPHYVVDEANEFEKLVIDYFTSEYAGGPHAEPVRDVQREAEVRQPLGQGPARSAPSTSPPATTRSSSITPTRGRPVDAVLRKARDPRKDQSYFLFSLRQEQLAACAPAARRPDQARDPRIARKMGLKTYDKEDSQEICFVPGQRLHGVPASRTWARRNFIPAAFTTRTATSWASTRASRCSPSASARACPAAAAPALCHRYRPGDHAA